jgi:c-di-GMP-binding flagellar brake protein YcgR
VDRQQNFEERRSSPRRSLTVSMQLREGPGLGELFFDSSDISGGGAFLPSNLLLKEGDTFWISFTLPGAQLAINTRGRVVRVQRGERPGMGIKFLDLTPAEKAALEAFLCGS